MRRRTWAIVLAVALAASGLTAAARPGLRSQVASWLAPGGAGQVPANAARGGAPPPVRPTGQNVIVILTDDLSENLLAYMPRTRALRDNGVSFSRYVVSDSLCCPSRASMLTGRYPHNTGVYTNGDPDGGFDVFNRRGNDRSTFATDFQAAGYATGFMGKYLNGYVAGPQAPSPVDARSTLPGTPTGAATPPATASKPRASRSSKPARTSKTTPRTKPTTTPRSSARAKVSPTTDETRLVPSPVPPGWSTWVGAGSNAYDGFRYTLNENGVVHSYGTRPEDYVTDVLGAKARQFIQDSTAAGKPFLLEVSTFAPHAPFVPAPRHAAAFPDAVAPRLPSYDAAVTDAPRWLRPIRPLTPRLSGRLDSWFRQRARSVAAVDELLGGLQAQLQASGADRDTYIVFTSDNGFHMGDYRLGYGKQTAFDTDIRVPFILAGPGLPRGTTVDQLAQNVDLRPTLAALVGIPVRGEVDGVSLRAHATGAVGPLRAAALVEHHGPPLPGDPDYQPRRFGAPPSYSALRLPDATYVEYLDGDVEYYDLKADPYQLANLGPMLPAGRRAELHALLDRLVHCHGPDCARGTDG